MMGKISESKKFKSFELLLNDSNLIIISVDGSGKINYVSKGSKNIIGYDYGELLGDAWWKLTYFSGQDPSIIRNRIQSVISGQEILDIKPYERLIKCKDGSSKWIEWRDTVGSDNSYISVGVDISSWKEQEERKIQSDAILENVKTMILVNDENGDVLYTSPSVERKLGYKADELLGQNWWYMTYDTYELASKVRDAIKRFVFNKEKSPLEIRKQKIRTKKGNYIWVEWTYSKGLNGNYIAVGSDITKRVLSEIELKNAKEFAEKSLKVKNDFLANMSHEIRTPLNAVIGFTDLLLETELTDEQQNHLQTMRKSGEILLSLINNVLDLSKLESNKFEIEEIEFDLHNSVEQIAKLMRPKAVEKGIELNLEIDNDVPKNVKGDPTRLEQILLNLLGNAVKFTNEGHVTLKVCILKTYDDYYEIKFLTIDTGIGIVSNKINTVFGVFTQAKSDTSRIYGGTGLGLAIVKKLVGLLKGTIAVRSQFGSGSEFELVLPLRKGEQSALDKSNEAEESIDQPLNLNILLVEDNKTNQLLAKTRLERWKCTVDIANNGIEGVKMTQKKLYDLILMDIQMPVMDGYEATKIIKNDISEEVSKIPIIAMSAYTSKADMNRAIRIGMSDFTHKPFKPKELYAVLKKYGNVRNQETESSQESIASQSKSEASSTFIDLKFLKEETFNEATIMEMLITSFISDLDEFFEVTKPALESDNWTLLHEATHKIKPGISMFGISVLEPKIHLLLNKLRKEEGLEDIHELFDESFKILESVKKELLHEINKMKNE